MSFKVAAAGLSFAAMLCASPSMAWEQLDLGTDSVGQPTYAPEGQGNGKVQFEGLPGVQLNRGGQQTAGGNCSDSQFRSDRFEDFGKTGTVTECNFGKFSLRTYNSGGGNSGPGAYNPFPVPGPLQQAGPPAGSGGFAPQPRW